MSFKLREPTHNKTFIIITLSIGTIVWVVQAVGYLDFISDNDENLKLMIDRMKNDTSEKCDIVFIKHPGQNGGPSKRGVSIDDKTAEYNLTYVQQGPNTQTSFKGDKNVVINESNYQIQIICYEQIRINKVIHDNIKNIRVLSIMRPYGAESKIITLIFYFLKFYSIGGIPTRHFLLLKIHFFLLVF